MNATNDNLEITTKIESSEVDRRSPKSPKKKAEGNWKATQGEMERKMKDQEEQEKRFKARLKVEQRYKETRGDTSDDNTSSMSLCYPPSFTGSYNPNPPPVPPPPELGVPLVPGKKKSLKDENAIFEHIEVEGKDADEEVMEQRKTWEDEEM